jgi:hypothetical protein
VDNFVDNATLDSPKRCPEAGFNRMPVAQANRESNEIKDLHMAAQDVQNFFQNFQVKISVHKATAKLPGSSLKDVEFILIYRAMGQRVRSAPPVRRGAGAGPGGCGQMHCRWRSSAAR